MAITYKTETEYCPRRGMSFRKYGRAAFECLSAAAAATFVALGISTLMRVEEEYNARRAERLTKFAESPRHKALASALDANARPVSIVHNTYALQLVESPNGTRSYRYIMSPAIEADGLGGYEAVGATNLDLLSAWPEGDYILCGQQNTVPVVETRRMPYNNFDGTYTSDGIAKMAYAGSAGQLPAPCDYAVDVRKLGIGSTGS